MSFYNTIFEEPTEGTPGPPGVSVDDIVYNDPEDQIDFILSNGIVKEIPFPEISLDTTAKIHLHGANDVDKFKITNEGGSTVLKVSTSDETEGLANFVQAPFLFVADNFDGVNLDEMENGMLYVYGEGNFTGSGVEFANLDFTEGRQTTYFKAYHQDERIEIMGSGRSDKFVITSELEIEALKVDTTGKGAVVAPTVRIGDVDESNPENIVGSGILDVYGETRFIGKLNAYDDATKLMNASLSIECPSKVSSIFRAVKFTLNPPLIGETVFFELDPDTQKVSITGENSSAKFQVSNISGSSIFTVDTAASQVKTKNNTLDNGSGKLTVSGGADISGDADISGSVSVSANLTILDVFGGDIDKFVVRGQFNEPILRVNTSYGAPFVSVKNLSITEKVHTDIIPSTDSYQNVGNSSSRWASVYGATGDFSGDLKVSGVVLANSIQPANTGHISIMTNDSEALNFGQMKSGVPTIYASFGSAGGFIPGSSNPTKNLGWVDNRWSTVYCVNIDMTGNISMPNTTSKITTPRINGISGSYLFIDAAASQGVALRVNNTGGVVALENIFRPGSDNTTDLGGASIAWKNIRLNGHILSNISGVSNIGTSTLPFNNIYAMNDINAISDANKKNTIVNSDLGLEFIEALRPVSYKMNDGTSGRTHYGLISQEVEEILPDFEKTTQDFAGFIKSPRTDIEGNVIPDQFDYALRYGEFIAPMIKAIQELSAQNAALVARIESLEEQMSEL